MEDGEELRAKFDAEAKAIRVTVHVLQDEDFVFEGADAHTFGMTPAGKTQPMSVYDLLRLELDRRGQTIFEAAGDAILAKAARVGSAEFEYQLPLHAEQLFQVDERIFRSDRMTLIFAVAITRRLDG